MMRQCMTCLTLAAALLAARSVQADATITSFDGFTSDDLYGSWNFAASPAPTIVSGATSYDVTATGYGSNYKYVGFPAIAGAGNTHIELRVNLSGPPAADGQLGPIVDLIDGDGTRNSYRWYGQTLGSHVLTSLVNAPFSVDAAGTTAGLDLNTLTHMHMQLDPGALGTSAAYTIQWQNLALVVPEPSSVALVVGCIGMLSAARRRR